MYVPSIARYIHRKNKKGKEPPIKLAGIGLGNGWIDASIQGPAMIDYAWWHGLINTSTKINLQNEWKNCETHHAQQPSPFHPFTTPDECGIMQAILEAAGSNSKLVSPGSGPNTYDVTTWDPYDDIASTKGYTLFDFFNDERVQKAIHAPTHMNNNTHTEWRLCIPGEGRRRRMFFTDSNNKLLLDDDRPITVVPYIAELLDSDAGIRVLVYNGDRDMSCCAQGSELALNGMEWILRLELGRQQSRSLDSRRPACGLCQSGERFRVCGGLQQRSFSSYESTRPCVGSDREICSEPTV
uniref:Pheromone-processing carboxypeptidase KEX1 n=1 Tax=Attheya septentrionalis TaxID=420275 RepID=A0A7S2UUM9_9STRA|mmetsp:Transcript_9387/g.17008  ORF Transcript_9387/g.17008 Transcript_9387/m.17008 type:complete len:297 (+) Transcript_9387:1061-1951(+)